MAQEISYKNCNELIRGNVKVEWVELGEGWNGDYDEDNPNDQELLRFDVSIWLKDCDDVGESGDWCDPGDASYCTRFPASATPEQRMRGLEIIMNEVYDDASAGHRIKKICEHLSWIGLDWLDEIQWVCPHCGGDNVDYLGKTAVPLCGSCDTEVHWEIVKKNQTS